MAIMVSSSQNKIFDSFRNRWVEATPEEYVRQRWLHILTIEKRFPKHLIAVEKSLKELHLTSSVALKKIPERRIDIVCFGKGIHPNHLLYPLLLIECKGGIIDEEAKQQLIGYNDYVQSHFIGLAGLDTFELGYYDASSQSYRFYSLVPSYEQLMSFFPHAVS